MIGWGTPFSLPAVQFKKPNPEKGHQSGRKAINSSTIIDRLFLILSEVYGMLPLLPATFNFSPSEHFSLLDGK